MDPLMDGARKSLVERRETLLRRVRTLQGEELELMTARGGDWVDTALDDEMHTVLGSLQETERREVQRIDAALKRMNDGAWGWCISCGNRIEPKRLRAAPEAAHCLGCAEVAAAR
ncbi:MAG: TraR/DksA family transcriptional regulator [Myxococcota bacterium]